MEREYTITLKAPLYKDNFIKVLKEAVEEQASEDYIKEIESRLKGGASISSINVIFEIKIKDNGMESTDNGK